MFGIKIKNQFLDLEQTKFNVKLQSALLFSKDNKDVIPSSLLLTTKLGPTKRNFILLQNPQILTNPRDWLDNEPCEIWANGSLLYVGTLGITEATARGVSVRVLINSVAKLADVLLSSVEYANPVPTNNVFVSAYDSNIDAYFDNYNFMCPRVFNPYGYGGYSQREYQNDITLNGSAWAGEVGGVNPFPKVTAILKGLFRHLGLNLDNCFEQSEELKRLLLYFLNPYGGELSNTERYNSIDIARHLPKVKASDFLKTYIRHFNLGLIVSNFDNAARIVKADDLANRNAVHDWTKKVLTGYTITAQEPIRMNLKTVLPSIFPRNAYELKKYNTVPPEGEKEYIIDQYNTDYVVKKKNGQTEYVKFDRNSNYTNPSVSTVYESKITTLPLGQIGRVIATSGDDRSDFILDLTMSADRNSVGYTPDTTAFALFFQRDAKNGQFVATSDIKWPDNTAIKVLGQNAQHSVTFNGDEGVYNRFHKNWVTRLDNARKIEVPLDLTIADLRRFNFDEKVLIGNIECFVESLDLEFSATGLNAVKGSLIQCI